LQKKNTTFTFVIWHYNGTILYFLEMVELVNQDIKFDHDDLTEVKKQLRYLTASYALETLDNWSYVDLFKDFEHLISFRKALKPTKDELVLVKIMLHIFTLDHFEPAFRAKLKKEFFENLKITPIKLKFLINAVRRIDKNEATPEIALCIASDIKYRQKLTKKYFLRQEEMYSERMLSEDDGIDRLVVLENIFKQMNDYQFKTKFAEKLWREKSVNASIRMGRFIKQEKQENSLLSNKEAMTMIKTSSRNQIDLINIADKRAGIMITVNAILLTLMIPLFASYIFDVSSFIVPMFILIITSGCAIVLATLATKPISSQAATKVDMLEGKRSLFYFDNFRELEKEEYVEVINELIVKSSYLEKAIYTDLYDTGIILSIKFKRLRWCYTVFALGIVLTLLSFMFCVIYFDI